MLRKTDQNFNWQYKADFSTAYINPSYQSDEFIEVQIPHTNIETPYNNFDEKMYQFESCYKKQLWIDSLPPNERVYIQFEGVMSYAKVYLNGIFVGEHKGGYTPFRIDLTDAAHFDSENALLVYVDAHERDDIPPFGFVVDYLTYGGIYREVALQYCHEVHIEHVAIKPKQVLTRPLLDIDLYFHNETQKSKELSCRFKLIFKDQTKKVFNKNITLNTEMKSRHNLTELIDDVFLWDLDNPNLYHLEISLFENHQCIDQHRIRFGFRAAEFTKQGFLLNGKPLKLRGLNRHQSFPYVGYAMPKNAQHKDAEILKYDLGVNIVRLSHYPQSNHFMDRCDELGLLVFDEIPGWQHIGETAWQDVALKSVEEMILKDINHPSVIIWGVRINESQDHDELYGKTNALARSLDNSRPTGGVRCIMNSHLLEDVYTYNDFVHTGNNQGLDKKKKVTKNNKPYLITEYNGHMFPTKKFDSEAHRIDHALRHLNVIEAMSADPLISGAIGWCMFDYNTHKDFGSGDKICYHGVLDMFRIPKYAAHVYATQERIQPIMQVASALNIGEHAGSLLPDIHIFTNCDSVKLKKNGQNIGTFFPNKKKYPNVKHPPIIIDDFIGDAIMENEAFSQRDSKIVKNLLATVSKKGTDLNVIDTLKMGWIFLKYKMNARDAEDLYTKYFGGWGGTATDYVFEGYVGDELKLSVNKSQVFQPTLHVAVDDQQLIEATTYETTRVIVKLVDEHMNDITYANDTFNISIDGPLEVIGPKQLSLIGGSIGFWVKTTGQSGPAHIHIHSERFGNIERTVEVIKQ